MENETLNLNEKIEELEAKAEKWDIIRNSYFFDCLKDLYERLDSAQVECSCLQQFVINGIEESEEIANNLPHIRYATQRLMDITNSVYYEKRIFEKLLD